MIEERVRPQAIVIYMGHPSYYYNKVPHSELDTLNLIFLHAHPFSTAHIGFNCYKLHINCPCLLFPIFKTLIDTICLLFPLMSLLVCYSNN